MTDLNALLNDFKDKRLAYKEINREAHEALLTGIVKEIRALWEELALRADNDISAEALEKINTGTVPKRGPGRPPKAEAV